MQSAGDPGHDKAQRLLKLPIDPMAGDDGASSSVGGWVGSSAGEVAATDNPLAALSVEEQLAMIGAPAVPKGRKASFYSEKNLKKRLELMNHPEIAAQLERLWVSANTDATDAIIDHEEYKVMHRKIVLALDPNTSPKQAQQQAEIDWQRDSDGKPGLDRKRFYWTWFELADVYVPTLKPEHYVRFLDRILRTITKVGTDGKTLWQDDRRIIEIHFERLRAKGKSRDISGSSPQ